MPPSSPARTAALAAALALASAAPAAAQGCDVELARFAPSVLAGGAAFGYRVHVDGDVAAIAAPYDGTGPWSFAGGGNPGPGRPGSVYVAERGASGWSLTALLLPPAPEDDDAFGWSVAVDGERIAVGAPGTDAPHARDRGAVFVYERDGRGLWSLAATVAPDAVGESARFGTSVALAGERLLAGAPYARPEGIALLLTRDPASAAWRTVQKLAAPDPDFDVAFGTELALGDGLAFVTGGLATLLSPTNQVSVYRDTGATVDPLVEVARIASPGVEGQADFFANDLAYQGGLLVVSAPGEFDFEHGTLGAAYAYAIDPADPGAPRLLRRVFPAAGGPAFPAEAVDASGEWLVAGVPSASPGGVPEAGEVAVFGRDVGGPDAFGQVALLTASDLRAGGSFGLELALDGARLFVGAPEDFTGGEQPGAAYALDLDALPRARWRNDAGGANPATHAALTAPALGTAYRAAVDAAASGHAAALLFGFARAAELPLPAGGVLLARGGAELLGRPIALAGPGGEAVFDLPLPSDASLCGARISTQAATFGGRRGFALTNAQDWVLGFPPKGP